jgi:antitoxin component YwqK of YwqJK toxin-antitoxin module
MKKVLIAAFVLCAFALNAQEIEPKYEKQGDLIKGTYYFDNGQISQEGTYKDGELHGKWMAYNPEGEKISEAYYKNGEKEGTWFFWNDEKLIQVEYDGSRVAQVVSWKDASLIARE